MAGRKPCHLKPMNHKFQFRFRWPVRQSSETSVEMTVPSGGTPVIHEDFRLSQSLSDGELDKAETAVIRAIAIIE